MKKSWLKNYPGYWRFALSYFSILILPLLFFTLLSERHFLSYYRNDVFRQSSLTLKRRQTDFETQMEQMSAISGQLAFLSEANSYNLMQNKIAYIKIQSLLQGIKATHSFFDRVSFYSMATPDTIYTDLGTYNSTYYKQYLINEKYMPIFSRLEQVKTKEWLLPEESSWNENIIYFVKNLQLVVPVPGYDNSYVIFDIPEKSMADLLNLPNMALLFDSNGQQLFPFSPAAQEIRDQISIGSGRPPQQLLKIDGKDYYQISVYSQNYGLYFTQIIEKNYLLSDVINLQRQARIIIVLVTLISGAFVYLVAFLNYQPIRRLNNLAKRTIQDIPGNLSGIAQAAFALNKMDEMYHSMEQKRALEQFMISLIHGRIRSVEEWEAGCIKTKISMKPTYMYAVMVKTTHLYPENTDVIREIQNITAPEYCLYGIQYPRQDSYLLLILCSVDNQSILRKKMFEISDHLSVYSKEGEPPQITVGGICRDYSQLPRSYMQVIMAFHFKDRPNEKNVLIFDDMPHSALSFVYPNTELSSLYEGIVNGDLEKTLLITDILIDMVRNQSYNVFLCSSLCYGIINTYLRAQEDLHIDRRIKENLLISGDQMSSLPDIENLIEMIYKLRDETAGQISKETGGRPFKNDITAQIIGYIDNHYSDSSLWVSSIADKFNMSISNLSHQFKASTGTNLSDYLFEKKMNYVKELLTTTDMTINEISLCIGYTQTTSFIRKFKAYLNMTPYEYRQLIKKT